MNTKTKSHPTNTCETIKVGIDAHAKWFSEFIPLEPLWRASYCRTSGRSSLRVLALQQVGYRNVKDLEGGFKGWVESGDPVYNMHGEIQVTSYGKKEE